jgi:4-hydroxy-3-polyprenylbenzoate decarboxylase
MPAFYARPETVADLVDFVVGKVLNVLGFEQALFPPWGAEGP